MTNKSIINNLKTKSIPFTLDEIREIMDEELEKDPSEMDTELIDLCADILVKAYNDIEETTKKSNRKKFSKVLLIAAVVVIFIAIAIPVSAAFIHNGVSDKIVQVYSDYFHIDLRQGSTNANHYSDKNIDLIQDLQERGFNNVILPSDLLNYNYSKDINIQNSDCATTVVIKIEDPNSKIKGTIAIVQYDEFISSMTGDGKIDAIYNHVEQISVNGLNILVFGNGENAYIKYLDCNTEYSITLSNCDFETSIEIANSIK